MSPNSTSSKVDGLFGFYAPVALYYQFCISPPEILMSRGSASRIKRETIFFRDYRADPEVSRLTGYYEVYQYVLGPTVGIISLIFN